MTAVALARGIGGQGGGRSSARSIPQHHIVFAPRARGSGVGGTCVAGPQHHDLHDDGLAYHGPTCTAVPCDLGSHDGGNDVADCCAHDPRFP